MKTESLLNSLSTMEEDGVRLLKNWETTVLNTWSKTVSKL
jgi:hypothetical protein